jgi:stress response protein YsnF
MDIAAMASGPETDANETIIPLASEALSVGRRTVEATTRVHVRTTETDHIVDESLTEQRVEIERVGVNRQVDAVPEIRTEGDITIIPVVREELVVQRRLILTEEIHLRRVTSTNRHRENVRLRHQEIDVEEARPLAEDHPEH